MKTDNAYGLERELIKAGQKLVSASRALAYCTLPCVQENIERLEQSIGYWDSVFDKCIQQEDKK